MSVPQPQLCTFEEAWAAIAASVARIRPVADRLIPAGAAVVAQAVSGESRERHQARLLIEARRSLLSAPGLALGLAWRAVRLAVEEEDGRSAAPPLRQAAVPLSEALCLAALALGPLDRVAIARRLLQEARWLLAFGDHAPDQRAEVLTSPLRLLAARGQVLRAQRLAQALGLRFDRSQEPGYAILLHLQASLLAQASHQPAAALAQALQAFQHVQPELYLPPALRHQVIAWAATAALNVNQLKVVEELRQILAEEGDVHPLAAPFRLWLDARLAIDRGEDAFARQALAEVVRHFEERAAGVEHRLASLDLASLSASFGNRQEALALAAQVMPELARVSAEEIRLASLERSIGESPFAQALRRRDLAPPGGLS